MFNSLVNCVLPQMFNRDLTVIWEHDDDGFQSSNPFPRLIPSVLYLTLYDRMPSQDLPMSNRCRRL